MSSFPDDLCCPVTLNPFVEPVTTRCGHNFEKSVLMQVLCGQGTPVCPTCRSPLDRSMPVVNYALKNMVERALASSSAAPVLVSSVVPMIVENPNRPTVTAFRVKDTNFVHIKVQSGGDLDSVRPVDFYFLNDRSGSMGERASKPSSTTVEAGAADAAEFARHQLTDFAVNSCAIMNDTHRVGLVVFDTEAEVVSPLCI